MRRIRRARTGSTCPVPRTGALRSWLAVAVLALVFAPVAARAAHTRFSFEFFEASLAPYGSWHVSQSLGRVWIPRVTVIGWHPYAYGHWMYTDLGWAWVSDYAWGAIPYHYGTWSLDAELGWVWVPGYTWAPAWVVFRSGPSYVGWAPVPPGYTVGASVSFGDYGPDHFVFVREDEFLAPQVQHAVVPAPRARAVFHETHVVNRISIENEVVVNRGLDVGRLERIARAPIERAPIERVPKFAPTERASRDGLRIETERGGVRAAMPRPANAAR